MSNAGDKEKMQIFSGNANRELAEEIAGFLGEELGVSDISRFSDGEIRLRMLETVRGSEVFMVQPLHHPVNENIMELLIMIDAFKRASAKHIAAVIPYYAYARQDRKTQPRDPITAKLLANLVTAAGANRVLTVDLHAAQIQGFFDIPVDNLFGSPILVEYFFKKGIRGSKAVVVSPDVGGVRRARGFAEKLSTNIAIIDKRRSDANVSEVMHVIGDVEGKDAILVDDMIDTAGSITGGALALKERGAKNVYACCTHPVFSGPAITRLKDSVLNEVVVTNTIPLAKDKMLDKLTVLSVAPLVGEAIKRIYDEKPVSVLFD